MSLTETNMSALEQAQQDLEDFLSSLPENRQKVLRAKQWRLEQELSKHKDPVDRMNFMVTVFWNQVAKFKESLDKI